MVKITLSDYNAFLKDCRSIWSAERYDLSNWAEIRDRHMVRHTMPRSDNGATGLLVGRLSLEIVEGDFYTAGSVEATVN